MPARTFPPGAKLTKLLTPLDIEVILSVASGASAKTEAMRLGITEGRYRHRYFTACSILRKALRKLTLAN